MAKRKTILLLEDILTASDKIGSYTRGIDLKDFMETDMAMDAVIHNFQVIGDAIKKIPEHFKLSHPEIDWRQITCFRNRIVHEYFQIDFEIVWKIKKDYLPDLYECVLEVIDNLRD
jgi:uncharacterized protein with HEPN domain